jgi:hypothetical protein
MLFREIMSFDYRDHSKHTNKLQTKWEVFAVEAGGT